MDPPFPDDEQPSRCTSGLVPGPGQQQSSRVVELAPIHAHSTPSPAAQDQSSHLPDAGLLPPTSILYEHDQYPRSTHSPAGYACMTSNPQYLPINHHRTWLSPPPGPEEFEEYPYNRSSACGSSDTAYNPSPVSPGSWPSPPHSFPQPLDQYPSKPQPDSIKNIQICTPTSTENFPLRGPQVPTPYTGSFSSCLGVDVDGLPQFNSPGKLQDFWPGALACTPSPGELSAGTSAYMPVTNQDVASLGRPESLTSPDGIHDAMSGVILGMKDISEQASGSVKGEEPYAQLIYRAFKSRPNYSMTLQEIYSWFRENTDKAKSQNKGWQNSIRHNLSMNAAFTKRELKKPMQGAIIAGNHAPSPAGHDPKRSTEWVLADWAIKNGVQSTTRYRKGNPTRTRGHGNKTGHAFQNGLQLGGTQISTKAISGRKGGKAASRAKMRSRQNGHHTPISSAATTQMGLPIGPPMRPAMLRGMFSYGGDDMLNPQGTSPHMVIKQEPTYSPLTPETNAADSFPSMLPEPILAHQEISANPGAAYGLASGSQGPMYNVTTPSPCDFPFNFNDISGMYQGEYSQSNGQHTVGGANGGLFGPMTGDTSYGWSNDAP
ncbi:hypothetical protein B0J13DRAFT_231619 [Dactylonectria estremocensis]|uniref:Fork-head domain-containing protein n=1 Tax=Dactylonectria estremocensis TaxID=1079267 RepID=A0A9P9JEZ7_9HYPO|nr:hypothetical protein B0J13DRAFT_231619 [Dactylonectria estremocensis]